MKIDVRLNDKQRRFFARKFTYLFKCHNAHAKEKLGLYISRKLSRATNDRVFDELIRYIDRARGSAEQKKHAKRIFRLLLSTLVSSQVNTGLKNGETIDWDGVSVYPLPRAFIHRHSKKLNWEFVLLANNLPERFIDRHIADISASVYFDKEMLTLIAFSQSVSQSFDVRNRKYFSDMYYEE